MLILCLFNVHVSLNIGKHIFFLKLAFSLQCRNERRIMPFRICQKICWRFDSWVLKFSPPRLCPMMDYDLNGTAWLGLHVFLEGISWFISGKALASQHGNELYAKKCSHKCFLQLICFTVWRRYFPAVTTPFCSV